MKIKKFISSLVCVCTKRNLLGTNYTVNEIAFELGFEYPQNLSKLFKNKTEITPSEYRNIQTFNN